MDPVSFGPIRFALPVFLLAAMAPVARATDWYVDNQNGSYANNGSSPSTAWRTLTHAVLQLQPAGVGPPQTIHVAAGVYDSAHGEQFPLSLRPWIQILGTPGGTISAEQVRELVAYAKRYHVEIVPEQQAFGHLHHMLTYELYSPLAETPHGHVLAPGQSGTLT